MVLIVARKVGRISGFAFYLLLFPGLGKLSLRIANAGEASCLGFNVTDEYLLNETDTSLLYTFA